MYSKKATISVLGVTMMLLPTLFGGSILAQENSSNHWTAECRKYEDRDSQLFCDNFIGNTLYKDQTSKADWYRFADGNRPASFYDNTGDGLRLRVSGAKSTDYSNAEVSLTKLYLDNANLLFGENTRADIRMKFSPNMQADGANAGTAKGTAGFLFWNYYQGTKDPVKGQFDPVRDAFGFTWASDTAPGLITFKAVGGVTTISPVTQLLPGFNMNIYHTYSVVRTHNAIKFLIDGKKIDGLAVNVAGGLQLDPSHKLTADFWADNASYFFRADGTIYSTFSTTTADQWIKAEYVKVTQIDGDNRD